MATVLRAELRGWVNTLPLKCNWRVSTKHNKGSPQSQHEEQLLDVPHITMAIYPAQLFHQQLQSSP